MYCQRRHRREDLIDGPAASPHCQLLSPRRSNAPNIAPVLCEGSLLLSVMRVERCSGALALRPHARLVPPIIVAIHVAPKPVLPRGPRHLRRRSCWASKGRSHHPASVINKCTESEHQQCRHERKEIKHRYPLSPRNPECAPPRKKTLSLKQKEHGIKEIGAPRFDERRQDEPSGSVFEAHSAQGHSFLETWPDQCAPCDSGRRWRPPTTTFESVVSTQGLLHSSSRAGTSAEPGKSWTERRRR